MTTKEYSVELNEEMDELFKALIEVTELDAGEVFANALCLYMDIIQQYSDGKIFLTQDEDGDTEEFEFFESEDLH
jgi:hypothetical protein